MIIITVPVRIPHRIVKFTIEENLKKNAKIKIICDLIQRSGDENQFYLKSNNPEAYFYAGMTVSELLRKYK